MAFTDPLSWCSCSSRVLPQWSEAAAVLQVLPVSRNSQMLTFTFQNGCVATLRTSGTEPKIKYYAEMCALPGLRSAFPSPGSPCSSLPSKPTHLQLEMITTTEQFRPGRSGSHFQALLSLLGCAAAAQCVCSQVGSHSPWESAVSL